MKALRKQDHEKNIRAVIAFLILLLAVGILLLFFNYRDNIIASNSFKPFITLAGLGLALLVGLLFLISSPQAAKRSPRKTTRRRKRR